MADPASGELHVPTWMDLLSGMVSRRPRLWTGLGNLETRVLADELTDIAVEAPVYVTGLARAGSTILLELLGRHPEVATHRYQDYPALHVPYFWSWFLARAGARTDAPKERAHADGIVVTGESPEAFEEMLWMSFFPSLHDPGRSNVLRAADALPAFDAFYRDHIRKLLYVRGRRRYVAKGNYNVTRLSYLHRLFPDARFVVPVRDPVWHIASLMKQHALFVRLEDGNPRALRRMQRAGHFEFGLDRRPVNVGDTARTQAVLDRWRDGGEVAGWADYWAQIHEHLAGVLEAEPKLREAVMIVRFEDLCAAPGRTIRDMLDHCRLEPIPALVRDAADRIRFPGYYRPEFSDEEMAVIAHYTHDAARCFGYGEGRDAQAV